MANFLECVWDIQISLYAPMFAAEFDLLENLTGANDENLKYIEDETGAEVVAAPQKEDSRTELLLCARHKTVESLNRSVYLLERLQESVLSDLKHFLRKHRMAPPGVLEVSDDIIAISKVYQCNLCAHAVGNQLELLKDHLKTPDHLVKKAANARREKPNEIVTSVATREPQIQVSETDTVAVEVVNALSALLKDQIKMPTVNMLQGLVEADARKSDFQHTVSSYPDSEVYCKMCAFQANSPGDLRNHNVSNKHRFKYLNLQLMLGHDKFTRFYGQTPLPGIQTSNGRALAAKIVQSRFDYQEVDREIFSNELHQELHRRMMLYTGWINKGNCKVCEKSLFPTWDGYSFGSIEWVQHVSGRSHAKACVSALIRKGKDAYQRDFGMTPIPAPSKVKAVLNSSDWMELRDQYAQMSHLSHLPSLASDIRNKTLVPETKPPQKETFGGQGDGQNTAQNYDDKRERSLHIRNYPDNVNESDIQSLFFPYGKVKSVRLFRDKGFGFVEFTEPTVVDYILREKINSFSMQGVKLGINGCGRKMMRWGSGNTQAGAMTSQPVPEPIPSQDVNNLQPDEQGFYTVSFTNEGHFSSFEEAVKAFMMFGLVKDYNNLASGKTYVRYLTKECVIKAWRAFGHTLKDFSFPLSRQYNVPPKPEVVQRLNAIARNMGFMIESGESQSNVLQKKLQETIPGLDTSPQEAMPGSEFQPGIQSPLPTGVPPGVLVTGPPPVPMSIATELPQATLRMLTAGVPLNPNVMATLQRQAAAVTAMPPPGSVFLGQPGLQQIQQAGLFRHPPPGFVPAGLPGLQGVLPGQQLAPGLIGPGMILGQQGVPGLPVVGDIPGQGAGDISNIASSVVATVQPQLEALQKAMLQKGVDAVQMSQLSQAMNTLQSFIANSNQQPLPAGFDQNKLETTQFKDNPPWLTATGDIDERRPRNASLASAMVSTVGQAPMPIQAANLGQAPWLAKPPESSMKAVPSSADLPPWSRQQLPDKSLTPGVAVQGHAPSAAAGRPPWARSDQDETETSQDMGNPPWSKLQSHSTQPLVKKEDVPWKSSKRSDSGAAPPWATFQGKAQATVPPWGKSQSDVKGDTKIGSAAAPWSRTKGSSGSGRSPPKSPWEVRRQNETAKKTKYDPFEREYKDNRGGEDVIDKRLAEINKKMAAMDRKIKEYEDKEYRRKGGRERSRSRSPERDRRRRSRSRERRDRGREGDEGRYRPRKDRSRSPRMGHRSPGRRDMPGLRAPGFDRWAREDDKKDLSNADIVEKLKRATGLTNDILVHNIMMKMKNVAPPAILALSECDGKVIQQLTLTGGAMVVPIMPVLQTLQQALGLARTQESYYIAAKIVGVFNDIVMKGGESRSNLPKGASMGSRWN